MATRQDLGSPGPLALAIRNAPTVATVLECTSRYLFLHAQGMSIAAEADPNGARGVLALRYGVSPDERLVSAQGMDLGLGFVHRALEFLLGGRYGLRSVDRPYRPRAPIDRYERFFGAPVQIARPAAMLRVPRSITTLPLSGADETLMRSALTFLAADASVLSRSRSGIVLNATLRPTGPHRPSPGHGRRWCRCGGGNRDLDHVRELAAAEDGCGGLRGRRSQRAAAVLAAARDRSRGHRHRGHRDQGFGHVSTFRGGAPILLHLRGFRGIEDQLRHEWSDAMARPYRRRPAHQTTGAADVC